MSVINLSFVSADIENNAIVKDVILEAQANGIKVVGAAGNYNSNAKAFIPACVNGVISVGAVNADGTKQAKSNYNASVYVVVGSTSEAAAKYSAILFSGKDSDKVVFQDTKVHNDRQRAKISLTKAMGQDERFKLGMNKEILAVQFGMHANSDIVAADGKKIPKDGLIEIISCDEKGYAEFKTDIPVGSQLYVKEYKTHERYILDDTKHPIKFEYAGQEEKLVEIPVNKPQEKLKNEPIRGEVEGYKVDTSSMKRLLQRASSKMMGITTSRFAKTVKPLKWKTKRV